MHLADSLNVLTSVSTAGAAIAAAWAVRTSVVIARRSREHERRDQRYRDCVDLLAAFEELQALWRQHASRGVPADQPESEGLQKARARLMALLRASREPLPIMRGSYFNHVGLPLWDDLSDYRDMNEVHRRLEAAPRIGDPESEESRVMQIRAEILGVLGELRKTLVA